MTREMDSQRLPVLDLIRGIAILEMILYHFLWDLVYLFGVRIPWYHSYGSFLWQQSIGWTFIILSGFSWKLGSRPEKRGFLSLGCGMIISLVTTILLPEARVRYGILTLIGSCILIWIAIEGVMEKIPATLGTCICFALFLACYSWIRQNPIQFPSEWLQIMGIQSILAYIGFPQKGFSSTDYFPIFPWILLFATGYFIYRYLCEKNLLYKILGKGNVSCINFLGKHSLIIYMIHQPICYIIGWLIVQALAILSEKFM